VRIEEDVPLARLTTLGTGGAARALARPETLAELEEALRWASERGLGVATVGLGSNLLVADGGVELLVVKLAGELAAVEVRGELLVAGGGAPNAVALHRARAAELGGFEFACAIPGTAGGGVWMNAGAYGSDWAGIMERALVVTAEGAGWLKPRELGMGYRHSDLRHGRVVAQVEFRLAPRPAAEIKSRVGELQAQRKAAQPTNKRISPKHANFIENAGGARSEEAVALMGEARRRAREQFGVELRHEVELLGPLELPPL
jgi:UDP-N-acetylmuramate dehydrogenase